MTSRDTTLRATAQRLKSLGYCPSSLVSPARLQSTWHSCNRASLYELANDEACILCLPTRENGADDDDAITRQVVDLIVSDQLLADPKAAKAILAVLERYGLTSGPYYTDGYGNRHHPLQWHGENPIYQQHRTRLCYEGDDHIVVFRQGIEGRYVPARDRVGGYAPVMEKPPGSYNIPVGCDWKQGHLLDTPYRKLPELLVPDASRVIDAVELCRWGVRPAAREAAA